MPRKRKGQRADGLYQCKRKMPDGKVKVYIETPDETGGFHDAICWLPDYTWEVHGYSESEMMYFKQLIRDNAHLIIEFSQEGGILNAANI